jgi:hypothetical protein
MPRTRSGPLVGSVVMFAGTLSGRLHGIDRTFRCPDTRFGVCAATMGLHLGGWRLTILRSFWGVLVCLETRCRNIAFAFQITSLSSVVMEVLEGQQRTRLGTIN